MKTFIANHNDTAAFAVVPLNVRFETGDHTELAGIYYPCNYCSAAVLICSSPGISQRAYATFAHFLNKQGFAVLTFDYRGIGESLFGMPVSKSKAKQHEWGQLDMSAALAYLSRQHRGIPIHVVAHDMAAVLIGLMPNHDLISGMVSLSGTSFYVPETTGRTRTIANLFFKFYVPLCSFLFGYVPLKFLKDREDIPAGVAKQWLRWCLTSEHIRNSFGIDIKKYFYKEFRAPILVLDMGGNLVFGAVEPIVKDITELYRTAPVEYIKIATKNYGFKKINHLDFFQSQYKKLWPKVGDWLKAPERQIVKTHALKARPAVTATLEAASSSAPIAFVIPEPVSNFTPSPVHTLRSSGQQTKFVGAGVPKRRLTPSQML